MLSPFKENKDFVYILPAGYVKADWTDYVTQENGIFKPIPGVVIVVKAIMGDRYEKYTLTKNSNVEELRKFKNNIYIKK